VKSSGKDEVGVACRKSGGEGGTPAGFWLGNLRQREHWQDPDADGRTILKMDIQEIGWGTWSGLIWLSLGRCGYLL